jgi:hypothetical protein
MSALLVHANELRAAKRQSTENRAGLNSFNIGRSYVSVNGHKIKLNAPEVGDGLAMTKAPGYGDKVLVLVTMNPQESADAETVCHHYGVK